jgi:PPM family protein phosphatase
MLYISESYCLHEVGGRSLNEDSVWPVKNTAATQHRLFLVCDGVGGNSSGEVASDLTCKGFASYFQQHPPKGQDPDGDFIEKARSQVMALFQQYIAGHPEAANMSTTLALAYLKNESVLVAWCGDSRIYQIRQGRIIFQSEDHSLVNELVKRGELTREEARLHPQRNVILRAIQFKDIPSAIECKELTDVREGDFILLCSDGLLENIGPAELQQLLINPVKDQLLDEFKQLCAGKTKDNYSMYLLQLAGLPVAAQPAPVFAEQVPLYKSTRESQSTQPVTAGAVLFSQKKDNRGPFFFLFLGVVALVIFISWMAINSRNNNRDNSEAAKNKSGITNRSASPENDRARTTQPKAKMDGGPSAPAGRSTNKPESKPTNSFPVNSQPDQPAPADNTASPTASGSARRPAGTASRPGQSQGQMAPGPNEASPGPAGVPVAPGSQQAVPAAVEQPGSSDLNLPPPNPGAREEISAKEKQNTIGKLKKGSQARVSEKARDKSKEGAKVDSVSKGSRLGREIKNRID